MDGMKQQSTKHADQTVDFGTRFAGAPSASANTTSTSADDSTYNAVCVSTSSVVPKI